MKILSNNIIFMCPRIVRSVESQSLDVHIVSFPAQYFLHEIHVRMSSVMQLVLVERSSDG